MRVPYSWLTEWVAIPWSPQELGSRLTIAGVELEALEPAAPAFSGVVVAEILSAERHPQADKLRVCRVSVGREEPVQIVCGASNARAGLRSALATVGAKLPGDLSIKPTRLRGVESFGMLASAQELGLAETSAGILELPADAPLGVGLREYLLLDDSILDLNVTPNRGDAMSVLGIAREVAALTAGKLLGPGIMTPATALRDTFAVHLEAPAACPRFAGCIVRGVNNRAATPMWMRERLRRAGVRSISPVVDVTNYVMLELGQPMHAYDLGKLKGEIRVRWGKAGESVTLLDGKTVAAQEDVLLITDRSGAIGVGGIMGGESTAVTPETTDVFFEAAHFTPATVIGRGRRWGLQTDASQRFERGVDPELPRRAMQRGVGLLASIAGGQAGPVTVAESLEHLAAGRPVTLRRTQLERLLGLKLEPQRVSRTLTALQMQVEETPQGWIVTPPSHRFDITIEADLIEEVARIAGYDSIPEMDAWGPQRFRSLPAQHPPEHAVLEALAMRGYQEAVTFAFVDPVLQRRLFPGKAAIALSNPIASDLSVMRLSLWPGLLRAALENQRRQQPRIKLFEHGSRFELLNGATRETETLAGLTCGWRAPEQWGLPKEMREPADFYDAKGDLEALLAATGASELFAFKPEALSCLHPGRAARLLRSGRAVGWIGELHPSIVRELDFTYAPVLFEADYEAALAVATPQYRETSRFPQVRRDLAVVVDEAVTLSALAERVTLVASSLLQSLSVFDVYRGPGLETGRKSIALGLIFQDISRTLTDEDVEAVMASVVADLRVSLNARIRE